MLEEYTLKENIIDNETMSDEELLSSHVIADDDELKQLDVMLSKFYRNFGTA